MYCRCLCLRSRCLLLAGFSLSASIASAQQFELVARIGDSLTVANQTRILEHLRHGCPGADLGSGLMLTDTGTVVFRGHLSGIAPSSSEVNGCTYANAALVKEPGQPLSAPIVKGQPAVGVPGATYNWVEIGTSTHSGAVQIGAMMSRSGTEYWKMGSWCYNHGSPQLITHSGISVVPGRAVYGGSAMSSWLPEARSTCRPVLMQPLTGTECASHEAFGIFATPDGGQPTMVAQASHTISGLNLTPGQSINVTHDAIGNLLVYTDLIGSRITPLNDEAMLYASASAPSLFRVVVRDGDSAPVPGESAVFEKVSEVIPWTLFIPHLNNFQKIGFVAKYRTNIGGLFRGVFLTSAPTSDARPQVIHLASPDQPAADVNGIVYIEEPINIRGVKGSFIRGRQTMDVLLTDDPNPTAYFYARIYGEGIAAPNNVALIASKPVGADPTLRELHVVARPGMVIPGTTLEIVNGYNSAEPSVFAYATLNKRGLMMLAMKLVDRADPTNVVRGGVGYRNGGLVAIMPPGSTHPALPGYRVRSSAIMMNNEGDMAAQAVFAAVSDAAENRPAIVLINPDLTAGRIVTYLDEPLLTKDGARFTIENPSSGRLNSRGEYLLTGLLTREGESQARSGILKGELFVCLADFNGSGAATQQDIFDFLATWLSSGVDLTGDGHSGLEDLFQFLQSWFAGCAVEG